jgi:glucuronoarabinoxylan endo-1,4-beta-xylanase
MPALFTVSVPVEISSASDVAVNLASEKQEIRGVGASSAWCGVISDSVMNSLYGNLEYSILRLRIEEGIDDAWKTCNYRSIRINF